MTSEQNAREHAIDLMQQGKITADEANVMIVQMMGVRVINGRIPADARKALNAAVKNGQLGRLKKEGLQPEVYHHINARGRALEERGRIARSAAQRIGHIFS